MPHRPSHTVEGPHEYGIEFVPVGISQQLIKARTFLLGARYLVSVFLDDLIATLLRHFPQIIQLCLGMLVNRGHAGVNGDPL